MHVCVWVKAHASTPWLQLYVPNVTDSTFVSLAAPPFPPLCVTLFLQPPFHNVPQRRLITVCWLCVTAIAEGSRVSHPAQYGLSPQCQCRTLIMSCCYIWYGHLSAEHKATELGESRHVIKEKCCVFDSCFILEFFFRLVFRYLL